MSKKPIVVRGAGIAGLWQALVLSRRGHTIILVERSADPFRQSCSAYAGVMLSPYCEEETSEPLILELGLKSIELWHDVYPDFERNGSLVVAQPRDQRELDRFARMTQGHERLDAEALGAHEPDLADRFMTGLFYAGEAHLEPYKALDFLHEAIKQAGVELRLECEEVPQCRAHVIDCRGLAARDDVPGLRGVRGERVIIRTDEVRLHRPVRLLHPRFPIYIVPWSDNQFMVGATQIESESTGEVSVRSALELLSTAYSLHPAFGEAEIVSFGASLRPAFADNLPKIVVKCDDFYVNGFYRHGFLLAPALAELVANHIEYGAAHSEVFVADCRKR